MNPSSSFGPLPDVCGPLIWSGLATSAERLIRICRPPPLNLLCLACVTDGPPAGVAGSCGSILSNRFKICSNLHKSSKTKQPNRPCIFVYMLCGWPPPNLSSNGCIVTCTSCSSYTALRGQKDDSGSGTTPTKNSILLLESPCPDVSWSFFLSHLTCSTHTHLKINSRSCSVAEK